MTVTDPRSGNINLDPDRDMFTILVNNLFIISSLDQPVFFHIKTFLRHSIPESVQNIPVIHAKCLLNECAALITSQAELLGPQGCIAATMADTLWGYLIHLPPRCHKLTRGRPWDLPLPSHVYCCLTELLINLTHTTGFHNMSTDLQDPFIRLGSVLNKLQHKGYRFLWWE